MIVYPYLPDELRIPLDDAGFPGVVAVVTPVDTDELAKWQDAFPVASAWNVATVSLAKQQLRRLEGFAFRTPDGTVVEYDPANPIHRRSLPPDLIGAVATGLLKRTQLSEEQEKNSARPSEPAATPSSGS